MLSFKLPMRKYFTLLYVTFSVMSFAQFKDNVFEENKAAGNQQSSTEAGRSSSLGAPPAGEQSEGIGPGNPGEPEPVPVDDYLPLLLIGGLSIVGYYQKRLRKIEI